MANYSALKQRFLYTSLFYSAVFWTVFPIVFIFLMIQMSAVTFPFMDHWEEVPFFVTYEEHGFWAAVREILTAPAIHARPVTIRLIFLINFIVTQWDLRSEYIYLYAALAATIYLHY